jgi:hypothetical protein
MDLSPDGSVSPAVLVRAGIACLCKAGKTPLEKHW